MASNLTVDKERIKEKDHAVIDGIDISGHWNRMFEQRVVWDYTPELIEKVTALEDGESFGWCYQCAQCVPVCPVDIVGSYGPRKIFRQVQSGMDLFDSPELWKCTTCMNCLRVCPKEVNMIKIMPAVREQAVLDGHVPKELQAMFQNCAEYGNPLGESPRKRADWTKTAEVPVPIMAQIKKPVDVLWFVSDYPSYHKRGIDASRALARVFHALGVDFGIPGVEEKCDGDSQRLAGEPGLFEELAMQNIKMFKKYKFNKIVVTDPHALNAFRKEYPKLGGQFEVEHYTQFLAARLEQLQPMLKKEIKYKVTFHDPCYLGRHNGEYEAPRKLLRAIPGLQFTEMWRCKENGYCCGGGGGGLWLDSFMADHVSERLSERRVREAVETGAEVLAICCPYEVSRFEDAVKSTGNEGKLIVRDIVELLIEAMEDGRA